MGLFIPSACFKPGLLAAALLLATSAQANPWRKARFPVPQFSGYTSHFGLRPSGSGSSRHHQGLDIAAPLGSPVLNWWAGRVERLINDGSCGIGLVMRSGAYEHLYCHLQGSVEGGTLRSGEVNLRQGTWLHAGEPLGTIGISGRSSGPHLHWGVKLGERWLDPVVVLHAMADARRLETPISRARP
ncbi:M23 family metallopeptidase [Synechococcus sp. W4D4]|uniref:M23 family metallopeptidase n=1 Tax=Synechococcus sp. W4D4 TaxID=3392294 RepID=UPI0039ECF82B